MKTKLVVASVLTAALTACGGGGGGGGSSSAPERPSGKAEGVAQHGPVRNGAISFHDWSDGRIGEYIAGSTTDEEGAHSTPLQYKDAYVWVAIKGGDYNEESSGRSVQMGSDELRAIVSYESGKEIDVQLTFFTNAAACLAEYMVENGATVGTAVTQANEIMTAYAGVPITATRPIDVTKDSSFTTQESQRHRYGMVIAGISQALEELRIADGAPENSTSYSSKWLSNVSCADLKADGLLNGQGEITNGNPTGQLYIGSTSLSYDFYRTAIARGILTFANNENNKTGLSAAQLLETANGVSQSDLSIFGNTEGQPVDTQGPVITSLIAENTLFAGTVEISFQVEDPIGLEGSEVSFYLDGSLVATAQPSDPVLRLNTALFSDGEHTIRVVAADTLGNPSEATFSYRFINSGAGIAFTSPSLVNSTSYLATGTFVDNGAGVDRIEVNGVEASVDRDNGTWEANISLIGGQNLVQAVIFDELGNDSDAELVIAVDLISPTFNVWNMPATFTNFDGLLNRCESGELDDLAGINRPVCLNAEKVTLDGAEVNHTLASDGYVLIGADIGDPQGAGVFSDISDLTVEYRYTVEEAVLVDWSPISRPNVDLRLVYLPFTTEFLGPNFYQTDIDTVHKVELRVTDLAGNAVSRSYEIKLDVLTPPLAFETSMNSSIFGEEFETRTALVGKDVVVSYNYDNQSNIDYVLNFGIDDEHLIANTFQSAIRTNQVRLRTIRTWSIAAFSCSRPDFGSCAGQSFRVIDGFKTLNLYNNSSGSFISSSTLVDSYGEWFSINQPSLAAPNERTVERDRSYGMCFESGSRIGCGASFGDTFHFASRVTDYEYEIRDGFPRNEFAQAVEEYQFQSQELRVINVTTGTEIFPIDGWYLVPRNTEIRVDKTARIPLITHYMDTRVSANDSTVPYGESIYEDYSIQWSIDTDIQVSRAIYPGSMNELDTISQTQSVEGSGLFLHTISRI